MLGLAAAGRIEMLQNMVDNFAFLVDRIGFVPNGNRTYFCTRSQPPFFAPMIELLAAAIRDPAILASYVDQLEREYAFWMSGAARLEADGSAFRRVFRRGNVVLNRYWDDSPQPRQESYAEDRRLAESSPREEAGLYRDIRAACESGWDFSSRWLGEGRSLASIRTTAIAPVDLNCLLYKLETAIAAAHGLRGDREEAAHFGERAERRAEAIRSHFFDEEQGLFVDLELPDWVPTGTPSLAAVYPLFFGIATAAQAWRVARRLRSDFLKAGGWVTSLRNTGQQWDAPNGWPPLQGLAYCGLRNYGFNEQAEEGARGWVACNLQTYRSRGQLLEKYDVEEIDRIAEGGEYAVQEGFGWTNGVLLALLGRLGIEID